MRASEVTLEWLLPQLEGVEGSGTQYYAFCPCHDDIGSAMKGLSITVRGKRILCKCHSPQCSATLVDVMQALGGYSENGNIDVTVRGKSLEEETPSKEGKGGLSWWENYTQVEASIWRQLGVEEYGKGVAFTFDDSDVVKVRQPPKTYTFVPKGLEVSPFWPIPGDELPSHISITEGESDCGTTYAAGLPPGFSVSKGSSTPLSVEVFQAFASRGVHTVTIYKDADVPGGVFTEQCADLATDAGLSVYICDLTRVVDPFHPIKDINSLWQQTDLETFHTQVERATYEVAQTRLAMTLDLISEEAEKEFDWIIPGFLAKTDKVLMWGPPKVYKTWLALDLMRSLVTGAAFMQRAEWTPSKPVKVLLVEEEGNVQLLSRRFKRLGITDNIDAQENLFLIHKTAFHFTDPLSVSSLIARMRDLEVDVVIFDPLQRMIPGINENNAAETSVIWDSVARMQQAIDGLAVVVVHHASKNNNEGNSWASARGSSRHAGEVDLGVFVNRHAVEEKTLSVWIDGRDISAELQPDESFLVKIEITDDSFTANAKDIEVKVRKSRKAEQSKELVFQAIRAGCETRSEIMKHVGLSDNVVIPYLKELVEEGRVSEEVRGGKLPNLYAEVEDE